jgi:hypothetical protein
VEERQTTASLFFMLLKSKKKQQLLAKAENVKCEFLDRWINGFVDGDACRLRCLKALSPSSSPRSTMCIPTFSALGQLSLSLPFFSNWRDKILHILKEFI